MHECFGTLINCPLKGGISSLLYILTHLAYIANEKKLCSILQQFTGAEMHDAILRRFMMSSFPSTMSL